jgi:hypothetical protein
MVTINAYPSATWDVECYWERSGTRGGGQIYVSFEINVVDMFINISIEGGDGWGSNWRSGEAHSYSR